jgi:hypothetical protein
MFEGRLGSELILFPKSCWYATSSLTFLVAVHNIAVGDSGDDSIRIPQSLRPPKWD